AHVTADGTPVNADAVVFTSSNTAIARVDRDGVVTALAAGDATIETRVGDPADKVVVRTRIRVTGSRRSGPPVAAFACTPNQLAVQCDATSSYDPSARRLTFTWDF